MADILGFKSITSDAYEQGQQQEVLATVSNALKDSQRLLDDPSRAKWRLKTFSDNLVVGYRYLGSGEGEFEFQQACYSMGHFQLGLARKGYFIRGGIAVGEIHIGDNVVFGHVLNELSEAERIANVPRIVLTGSALDYLDGHFTEQTDHYLRTVLRSDWNSTFINYLHPLQRRTDDRKKIVLDHKRLIEENLRRFRSRFPIHQKYIWAANYHNSFCRESGLFATDEYLVQL
jgi:hypothetical protein